MKVLVVAEYYPREAHPVFGIWSHRQALAAREAGAEVRVLVLHRPLPSLRALREGDARAAWGELSQPARATLDGLHVRYVRYLSPPRPRSYASWGAWAAPVLKRALVRVRREFDFDLVHAHYAVPAGDAIRRAAPDLPLVVSVHGGDVHGPQAGSPAVRRTFTHARLVLANSAGTAERCRRMGAQDVRIVHLGTDPAPALDLTPAASMRGASAPTVGNATPEPTLVSVGDLIARKRHADVIAALPRLRESHPALRYVIVGDGPERNRLAELAGRLGVADLVTMTGALPHEEAVNAARSATLFVLPSVSEAFGVSYVEAMAAGVPAVGCRGEDGPEEIARIGGGMVLVEPGDSEQLGRRLNELLTDPRLRATLGAQARANVEEHFTWPRCGAETVAAYRFALEGTR